MTEKEKAQELYNKIKDSLDENAPVLIDWLSDSEQWDATFKKLAIIAVDEILKGDHLIRTPLSFWQKVKEEIQSL